MKGKLLAELPKESEITNAQTQNHSKTLKNKKKDWQIASDYRTTTADLKNANESGRERDREREREREENRRRLSLLQIKYIATRALNLT